MGRTRVTKTVVSLVLGAALAVPMAAGAQGPFPDFIPFSVASGEIPEGIAIDKAGNVYVSIRQSPFGPNADLSDQIWKFSPSQTRPRG